MFSAIEKGKRIPWEMRRKKNVYICVCTHVILTVDQSGGKRIKFILSRKADRRSNFVRKIKMNGRDKNLREKTTREGPFNTVKLVRRTFSSVKYTLHIVYGHFFTFFFLRTCLLIQKLFKLIAILTMYP